MIMIGVLVSKLSKGFLPCALQRPLLIYDRLANEIAVKDAGGKHLQYER